MPTQNTVKQGLDNWNINGITQAGKVPNHMSSNNYINYPGGTGDMMERALT